MTLQQLNYVITASEEGSMNKAAQRLYVAQPSLTSAIKELENELGIVIFNRGGRGITLTNDGAEFLLYACQIYNQYEALMEKYDESENIKKKFGVSAQHYSFAVKAFVEMVKTFDTTKYEFAMRETKTGEIIEDVRTLKSEVGILYLSDFNRKMISRLLKNAELEFHKLVSCNAFVYLWHDHPLAKEKSITVEQLEKYPCLTFEQGDNSSFYFAEEIIDTSDFKRTVKVCDRATMLNLMAGLNGYTICSQVICEELNGTNCLAVPLESEENGVMEIGYVVRKDIVLSDLAKMYIAEIKKYCNSANI